MEALLLAGGTGLVADSAQVGFGLRFPAGTVIPWLAEADSDRGDDFSKTDVVDALTER